MSENQNQATAIAESMYGVFGKKPEEVKVQKDPGSGGGVYFNPDAKSAPNQIYRAIVKFLPKLYDLENPDKTETVETVSYWIPEGNGGFRYTSAKSLGKKENCPVANKYWEWDGSDDARLKKMAKKLSYKRQYFALIQVVEDQAKPENKGKLFLYDVPYAIQKKITAVMYPSKEDIKMGAVANNVFDPLEGFPLVMKVAIKDTTEGEFRDYDGCEFKEKLNPRMIVDFEGELLPAEEPKTEQEIRTYQEKAIKIILAGPSLKDVEYKPADEATLARIQKSLTNLESGNIGQESETSDQPTEQPAATNVQTEQTTNAAQPEQNANVQTEQPTEVNETKAETTSAVTSANDLVASVMSNKAE